MIIVYGTLTVVVLVPFNILLHGPYSYLSFKFFRPCLKLGTACVYVSSFGLVGMKKYKMYEFF